jgi:ABC-2 type transport system permease protein
MLSVVSHALRRRRMSLLWWGVGVGGLAGLLAVAYPTVRGNSELDRTFGNLPPGVEDLLGLGDGNLLTAPAGYLDSQFFANILPVMLLIFAVGVAAWIIAGDEAAGTFELLVVNPISRVRVAVARLAALAVMLAALAAVSAITLIAFAPSTGLSTGLSAGRLVVAAVAGALLAMVFGAAAFAVGAATGSRPAALATASALAVAGYIGEGLAHQVPALGALRFVNPWHWLLAVDPLRHGLTWQAWAAPIVASVLLVAASLPRLAHRDLR